MSFYLRVSIRTICIYKFVEGFLLIGIYLLREFNKGSKKMCVGLNTNIGLTGVLIHSTKLNDCIYSVGVKHVL